MQAFQIYFACEAAFAASTAMAECRVVKRIVKPKAVDPTVQVWIWHRGVWYLDVTETSRSFVLKRLSSNRWKCLQVSASYIGHVSVEL